MKVRKKQQSEDYLLAIRSPGLKCFNFVLILIWSVLIITPLLMVFLTSFKTNKELAFNDVFALPESILYFDNYKVFIDRAKVPLSFRNTLFQIAISVPISLLMAAMASYVLDRFRFRGRNLINILFAGAQLIPGITTQVVKFTMIRSMGLYNTRWAGVIMFTAADIIQIYLFRQFVKNVPKELDESAMIDGASLPTIFFRIIMPQLVPAFATTAILKALTVYNDLFICYLYMPASELRMVSQTLRLFTTDYGGQWNVISAGVVLIMLPTLVLYLFSQRWIISGMSSGAVKG